MKTKQIIAFTRDKFFTSLETAEKPEGERLKLLAGLSNELLRYGYKMSNEVLLYLSKNDIEEIYKEIIPLLIEKYHSGESFKCLYPGFPEQVVALDESVLLSNQQMIYDGILDIDDFINNSTWYTEKEIESNNVHTTIGRMTEDSFMKIPQSIMVSGNSLQESTKDELMWFLGKYPNLPIPERIPFKETLCMVMAARNSYVPRDINDILRFGMYCMGSDPCLPNISKKIKANPWSKEYTNNPEWRKLKALPRSTRKSILGKIQKIVEEKGLGICIPDAKRFYGHWILLSERVHSGDYVAQYPKAREFFATLQTRTECKKYKTWNSKLQDLYNTNAEDSKKIAEFISSRPGELVRRFDSLLRRASKTGEESEIMDIFLDTKGMKNKTLLELMNYYDKRLVDAPRLISIPGSRQKYELPSLSGISKDLQGFIQDNIVRKVLLNISSNTTDPEEYKGKVVYLDPDLKNIPVPRDMRSATSVIPQGTKFDIPEDKNIVRFFVHWKQEPGRDEDLDLHAFFVSEDMKNTRNIGWNTGLKDSYAAHSGDVLNRPGDCAEYCDCNIQKAIEAGFRYLVMDVYDYKGRNFDLPAWLGYSYRNQVQGGDKHWVPQDQVVCEKIEKMETCQIAAWLFDLVERKAILLGVEMNKIPVTNGSIQCSIIKFYTAPQRITTYMIAEQYYLSRGAEITNQELELDEEGDPIRRDEYIYAKDLVKDYTKILEMIGE